MNKLPVAPIQDDRGILCFSQEKRHYMVNTDSQKSREYCLKQINEVSNTTFAWHKEIRGKEHWVLYDTNQFYVYYGHLYYKDKSSKAPTIPINATSCYEMFRFCTELDLSRFNTENVVEMGYMFEHYRGDSLNIEHFSTGNVTNMYAMFRDCHNLKRLNLSVSKLNASEIIDRGEDVCFNTANVNNMSRMFYNCQSLRYLILSGFDMRNVTNMSYMFWNCRNLEFLDLEFNQEEFYQDSTPNLKFMDSMFENCCKLSHLDLTCFNTCNVTKMRKLFYNCENLREILVTEKWKLDYMEDTDEYKKMFYHCDSLPDKSHYYDTWTRSTPVDFGRVIHVDLKPIEEALKIHNDFSKIPQQDDEGTLCFGIGQPCFSREDTLSFSPERQQNNESLLHFGHGKYNYEVNVNSKESREKLKRIFNEQHNAHYDWFKEKTGKKHWVFYNTEMYIIRSGGLRYNEDSDLAPVLPINASSCCDMFRGCTTLERLDLSHFRTENIVTMMSMFRGCRDLKELDLSNFSTENIINMSRMFEDCTKLTTLSVKNFSTVNTISMANIFQNCESLITLDLLSFDTSNVKSFANFFNGCKSLKRIYVSPKWVTGEYIDNCFVFDGCVNLPHFSQDRINCEMLVDVKDGGYLTVVK